MSFPIPSLVRPALLALATCLAAPALAQDQSLPTPVPTAEVPATVIDGDGPALWKVADDDTTIYLFGTVHSLPSDVDWYRGELVGALAASDELVTEIDTTPETLVALQQVVAEKALLKEGSLRELMNPEQRATYEGAMQGVGLPVAAYDAYDPWFAALMLSNTALSQQGFSPDAGVEKTLEEIVGPGMARGALETVEFQMSIFDELPMESQIRFLIEGAEEIGSLAAQLQAMIDEWAVGDADGLAALLNEAFEADPVLGDRLLYARNADWAVWIDDRLDEPGVVFMAVGAGHLAGDKSVQALLAERGITTLRVQ